MSWPTALCVLLGLTNLVAADGDVWQPVGLCGGGAMFSLAGSPHDPKVFILSCDMSGAYATADGGRSWRMIHHRQLRGCTTCAAAFHPSDPKVIVAPSGWGGRLRISRDGGATWQPLPTGPPRGQRPTLLYFDPDPPASLFLGTFDGLSVTRDEGRSWRLCAGVAGKVLGMATDRASAKGRRTHFVATDRGVFRSEDDGAQFAAAGEGLPAGKVIAFAGGSDGRVMRLYASVPCRVVDGRLTGGVYASTDGRRWERRMNPRINVQTRRRDRWANGDLPEYRFLATTNRRPLRAYAYCTGTSYHPPNHSTVYRTDDGGGRWRAMLFSDPRFKQYNAADDYLTLAIGQRWQNPPRTLAISPADDDVVMMAGSMFLTRTENGGRFWRVGHAVPARGATRKNPRWVNNGLVVTSTWHYYADPHQTRRHYICYTDIGFARSLDAGKTWIWQGHDLPWKNTIYELAFDPDVPGRIWGAFSNVHDIPNGNIIHGRHSVRMSGGVAISTDFGKTWKKLKLPEAPAVSIVLDPTSPRGRRTLYASLFERGVYKSTDGGRTWRPMNAGLGSPKNLRVCRLQRHRSGGLFVVITAKETQRRSGRFIRDGVGLYRWDESAASWTKITASLPLYWPKDFTVHPTDADTILLAAADVRGHEQGGLYRTTDGGASWKRIARKGRQHFGAFYHPRKKGWIYLTLTEGAVECGLYLSRDDGATWQPFSRLPFANIQRVHFLETDPDHLYVTTFGGSVFKGPPEPAS